MEDYRRWTKDALLQRIEELEKKLQEVAPEEAVGKQAESAVKTSIISPTVAPAPAPSSEPSLATSADPPSPEATSPPKKKAKKVRDPSSYATRFIALKMAYLGKRYGGFEFQPSGSLPTIEEELWKALVKSHLVFPTPGTSPEAVDFNVCEYSKCGRTDRGVSAFGQVVALRVRSQGDKEAAAPPAAQDEIAYTKVLNRLLPPDIRVLAWCPHPPQDFSARFSCRERRYRYFFTQPAYWGGNDGEGSMLDIEAMRKAAQHFVGLHDFRNFCKVDPSKQITNFLRRMFSADIVEVPGIGSSLSYLGDSDKNDSPKVYAFDVRGSAFLWHQIRHMVAVLFLVGQGRESPDIVPALLDVERNPCRPNYTMADETPLVLWDCVFPPLDSPEAATSSHVDHPDAGNWADSLAWRTIGDDDVQGRTFVDGLWRGWRSAKMDEILANRLLDVATRSNSIVDGNWSAGGWGTRIAPLAGAAAAATSTPPANVDAKAAKKKNLVFEGGDGPRLGGKYIPLLQRPCIMSPEEVNNRYARLHGFASAKEMQETENWRSAVKARKEEKRQANGD